VTRDDDDDDDDDDDNEYDDDDDNNNNNFKIPFTLPTSYTGVSKIYLHYVFYHLQLTELCVNAVCVIVHIVAF